MTPTPNGLLHSTAEGRDLVLTRTFAAPIDDVWASITESERTARWFCSWEGDAAPGKVIRYRMEHEEGTPSGDMTVVACEPPRHLAVAVVDDYGSWRLDADLVEADGITVLTFTHHLDAEADAGSVGPGWEYYLDLLVVSRTGGPKPSFDDYYPSMKAYYEDRAAEAPPGAPSA
jgi:uncharacterized protein YndB with AHSA1/START domain